MAELKQVNDQDYQFQTQAKGSAQTASDEYSNRVTGEILGYLDKSYAAQQEAQEIRKQSALDAIARQVRDTGEQYRTDVQNNYIQKMIAQHTLANELNSQGINNTGLATSQKIGLNNQYAQNYNQLTTQRDKDIRALGEKEIDTINEYNAQAKELESDYNKNVLSQKEYIEEQKRAIYNEEYQREYNAARQAKIDYDNAQQLAYANYWAEIDRENALKQQEWEREFAQRELNYKYAALNLNNGGSGGITDGGTQQDYTKMRWASEAEAVKWLQANVDPNITSKDIKKYNDGWGTKTKNDKKQGTTQTQTDDDISALGKILLTAGSGAAAGAVGGTIVAPGVGSAIGAVVGGIGGALVGTTDAILTAIGKKSSIKKS